MRRLVLLACAGLGLALAAPPTHAGGPARKQTAEEHRLRGFWQHYYDALRSPRAPDRIDWVAYYKNHGHLVDTPPGSAAPGPCLH